MLLLITALTERFMYPGHLCLSHEKKEGNDSSADWVGAESRGAGGRNPCWVFGFFKFPETLSTRFNDDLEYMNLHSWSPATSTLEVISEFLSPPPSLSCKIKQCIMEIENWILLRKKPKGSERRMQKPLTRQLVLEIRTSRKGGKKPAWVIYINSWPGFAFLDF